MRYIIKEGIINIWRDEDNIKPSIIATVDSMVKEYVEHQDVCLKGTGED